MRPINTNSETKASEFEELLNLLLRSRTWTNFLRVIDSACWNRIFFTGIHGQNVWLCDKNLKILKTVRFWNKIFNWQHFWDTSPQIILTVLKKSFQSWKASLEVRLPNFFLQPKPVQRLGMKKRELQMYFQGFCSFWASII